MGGIPSCLIIDKSLKLSTLQVAAVSSWHWGIVSRLLCLQKKLSVANNRLPQDSIYEMRVWETELSWLSCKCLTRVPHLSSLPYTRFKMMPFVTVFSVVCRGFVSFVLGITKSLYLSLPVVLILVGKRFSPCLFLLPFGCFLEPLALTCQLTLVCFSHKSERHTVPKKRLGALKFEIVFQRGHACLHFIIHGPVRDSG